MALCGRGVDIHKEQDKVHRERYIVRESHRECTDIIRYKGFIYLLRM